MLLVCVHPGLQKETLSQPSPPETSSRDLLDMKMTVDSSVGVYVKIAKYNIYV